MLENKKELREFIASKFEELMDCCLECFEELQKVA
jgi:hypothetical protein